MTDFDTSFFRLVNGMAGFQPIDWIMLRISDEKSWVVLFPLFLILLWKKGVPRLGRFFFAGVLAIAAADWVAYRFLKPFFARLRPCHALEEAVRLVQEGCGGLYGLPSNHAANAMSLAVIGYLVLGKPWGLALGAVAAAVGLSRIYLGVHYPGDILLGFMVGGAVALIVHLIVRYLWSVVSRVDLPGRKALEPTPDPE